MYLLLLFRVGGKLFYYTYNRFKFINTIKF